ncbi:MAG: FtsQ-type POTRA domain-containing protein [Actinobacteria bacterium]|nr:FtsQ-type POTRA domain-containing protein [Actinomycetota bacterium]MBU1944476.1 FtsQ-type POTRA domain-containing protein [Actinomycetota bacterium]MBU2688641.1 FtsQ-type POTRA domain-containing protein [Actinomycetota bacterium]
MKRLKRNPDSRISAKRISWHGLRNGLLWVAAMAVVAAGGMLALAMFTGACEINAVRVEGNHFLTSEQVVQISGVEAYTNLFTLPVGELSRDLEANSWVADARIERHLLHTVIIRITERSPIAMLYCGGPTFLVDRHGYVIAGAPEDQLPELPRIYGGDMKPPEPGTTIDEPEVAEGLEVMASMPPGIRDLLQLCNPYDGRGQVFVTRGGFNIVYGSADQARLKNEVLQAVLVDVSKNNRGIAYVDVRVPDSPVIKPI